MRDIEFLPQSCTCRPGPAGNDNRVWTRVSPGEPTILTRILTELLFRVESLGGDVPEVLGRAGLGRSLR
jgi:hypothetical protein